ncbi:pyruvate kinase, partial [Streptomyces massasporeus]
WFFGAVDDDVAGGAEFLEMRLLTEPVPWPAEGRLRRAGVSSFGVSGTNAHVILEEAPEAAPVPEREVDLYGPVPWVVSGRDTAGVRGQAARLAEFVRSRRAAGPADREWIAGVAAGLAGRAALEQRAVVVGADADELLAGLEELMAAQRSLPARTDSGVVFVFPGQGGQWVGMGRELLLSWPVFAERMAVCERALDPFVDWSLRDVLTGADEEWSARVDVVQPVLWAVMVSLAEAWRAAGVVPDVVVGHSQGEIAAAVVAGRLSVEDGARVVALRSRALRQLAGRGAMASVSLDVEKAEAYLPSGVTVAAVNAPGQIVVSGPPEEIAALCARLEGLEIRARRIEVDYASHHAQVEEIAGELRAGLEGLSSCGSEVAMWSTVTGELVADEELDAGYWYRNLRQPVLFETAVRAASGRGRGMFVEVGPHPVLGLALSTVLGDGDRDGNGRPKIRLGRFREGPVLLERGDEFTITVEPMEGDRHCCGTTYSGLAADVTTGERILVDDGRVTLEVVSVDGPRVNTVVIEGGMVSDNKGLNLPGVAVSVPALSEKDIEDLRWALRIGADVIALSFVRSAQDIDDVHRIMDEEGRRLPVIAKIEKPQAVENIEEIVAAFDGIMVARGDLGVEMPLEQVPI